MKGIQGAGTNHPAHNTVEHASRRQGSAGHPGKHLGQFKHQQVAPDAANMPLIQQQLSAIGNSSNATQQTVTQHNTNTQQHSSQPSQQSTNDLQYLIALDALRSTQNSISNQLSFTSHFNALTTAF